MYYDPNAPFYYCESNVSQPFYQQYHIQPPVNLFKNILLNNSDICLANLKISEEQIIVLASDLSMKSFFEVLSILQSRPC
jgi:hypothetical protein